jgi:hypothetical protein
MKIQDVPPKMRKQLRAQGVALPPTSSKMLNKRCKDALGRSFDSIAERDNHLALEKDYIREAGYIVLRQVSVIVSDGPVRRRRIIDHAVLARTDNKGEYVIRFFDTKGRITPADRRTLAELLNLGIDVGILPPNFSAFRFSCPEYASDILDVTDILEVDI